LQLGFLYLVDQDHEFSVSNGYVRVLEADDVLGTRLKVFGQAAYPGSHLLALPLPRYIEHDAAAAFFVGTR